MKLQKLACARNARGVAPSAYVRQLFFWFAMTLAVGSSSTSFAQAYNPLQTQNRDSSTNSDSSNQTDQNGNSSNSSSQQSSNNNSNQLQSDTRIRPVDVENSSSRDRNRETGDRQQIEGKDARLKPLVPSEFELHVERVLGRKLPRFGANLLLPSNRDYAIPATATIPPDYALNVGDTVGIAMTGSVEGSVDVEIDTNGKIFLPKVGSVMLAGVRYRDLKDRISAAIGRQYRGYEVTVSIPKLRGIRVYVTGFANNPGAYSVNSLSTAANAILAAGGPSSGGSLRSVQILRNGAVVGNFDLYDLILHGDRSKDRILQNEDVIFIPPLGAQVAITGSVNVEAVYELRKGETLEDVIKFAGGPNDLADPSRLLLYRMGASTETMGRQIVRSDAASEAAAGGDIVQVLAQGDLMRPLDRQSVLVRIEGEVAAPGNYFVQPGTSLGAVLAQAGGATDKAYLYGTRLERLSVKKQQRESFKQAIEQLELMISSSALAGGADFGADQTTQLTAARGVLERLKLAEPDGRVVFGIDPKAPILPADLTLENNDHIVIPSRPVTVGVFGAVYRPASFLIDPTKPQRVRDYIERAGGTLRAADHGGIFVLRASGDVVSKKRGALKETVLAGDVVFVPVKTSYASVWAKIRDISSVIFQFGLGAAAFVAVTQ